MYKIVAVVVAGCLFLAGCGRPLTIQKDGKSVTYPTYGILNEGSSRSRNVCYQVSVGNIVWSIILIESIVFPVYFIGFSLYNPTRLKKSPDDDCLFPD